ncbi:MAG TPA: BamA/TamA family outer membrane protein [Gemmatirosa sp.]
MHFSAWVARARTVPALARAVVLAVGAAVAASARPVAAQPARDLTSQTNRPEVREVRFVGVHAVPAATLSAAVATQASQCLQLIFRPFCLFSKSPYIYQRQYLDHTELARDVVRVLVFYYKRGWRDAQVDTAVTRLNRREVAVTFTVREGTPTRVRTLAVQPSDSAGRPTGGAAPAGIPSRELAGLLAPKPGLPLNTILLDSSVVRVRDAYWERGYGNATVARARVADDTAARAADVVIPVDRGPLTPIRQIDIVRSGSQREVSDRTIRDAITLKPGDLFRRSEVARSQRALYESGLFRSAVIDTAVATEAATGRTVCASQAAGTARPAAPATANRDSTKALAICVTEAALREARTSFGFNTADFFQVEGRFTHNYFTGTSRRLDVQGVIGNLGAKGLYRALPGAFENPFQSSNLPGNRDATFFLPTYNVGVNLQQQYFGSPRNTLGLGVFASRRSSPGVYVDQSQGANVSFTRRVLDNVPVSLNYRFALSRVQAGDVYFCVNFGVCDAPTIGVLQSQKKLSPLSGVVSFSRTDDPLEPTRGTQGQLTLEHASAFTLSDFKYNRVFAEVAAYHPAPAFPRITLAARLRAGYVAAIGATAANGVLPPQVRFYAGGAQSVRGYGENQLGPRTLTVAPNDVLGSATSTNNGVTTTTYACPAATAAAAGGGDPNSEAVLRECFTLRRTVLGDSYFTPRALGGSALLEGSVEARVPLYGPVLGAVFVDAGALGNRSLRDLASGTLAVTPGFGVRYRSPVGPIRVDLGIRPKLVETLPVITQFTDSAGVNRLLTLTSGQSCSSQVGALGCRNYPADSLSGFRKITGRLVLHLSIGEAF